MGGGDLNSKKSWHPNTMKNQERVWKAEQVAAEEKKRILEFQRECAEEKEQAEFNKMAKRLSDTNVDDNRLHWMYDKPDKKVQEEDYLLGKAIGSKFDKNEQPESDIPAVTRRVVGSSMLTTAGDIQVDIARKMREDPLLLVKERERAARAALLNNPIHRRRIAELLRKEQEQKDKKVKKKSKKHDTKKDKEKHLDKMLASKLSALGSEKIDLALLLVSDDSSSDEVSSDESKLKKKKKKKHKKNKKLKISVKNSKSIGSDTQHSDHEDIKKRQVHGENSIRHDIASQKRKVVERKRKSSSSDVSDNVIKIKKRKRANNFEESRTDRRQIQCDSVDKKHRDERQDYYNSKSEVYNKHKRTRYRKSSQSSSEDKSRDKSSKSSYYQLEKKSKGLSKEEKEARLKAMAEAGVAREKERGRRVAQQRAADAVAEKVSRGPRLGRSEAHSLPESLESRINSNRHYIQRDKRHMDEHFARR